MKPQPLRSRVTPDQLRRLYHEHGLSTLELAERLGSNRESVRKLIHRHRIPMRSTGAGKRLCRSGSRCSAE
jgi:excisionase family DNA binding protein